MPSFPKKTLIAGLLTLLSWSAHAQEPGCTDCFAKRWIYFGGDLSTTKSRDAVWALIGMAKAEGYNGIALDTGGNGGYDVLVRNDKPAERAALDKNLKDLVKEAASKGIELIPVGGRPTVPSIFDKTLKEAIPTKTVFTVENDVGIVKQNLIDNSKFDTGSEGWKMDDPWVSYVNNEGYLDPSDTNAKLGAMKLVPSNGKSPTTGQSIPANSRLRKTFTLPTRTAYRLTYRLKAGPGYDKAPLFIQILDETAAEHKAVYVNGLGWGATDGNWNAKSNKDLFEAAGEEWKQYELTFNTGNYSKITIWFANQTVGDTNTAAFLDDIELREVGLAQPIFGDGRTVSVRSTDGLTDYGSSDSSTDFTVDAAKERLQIKERSRIKNGTDVVVSWNHSTEKMTAAWGVNATACNPLYFYWQDVLHTVVAPYFNDRFRKPTNKFFVYYDEIRAMNWDQRCKGTAAENLVKTANKVGIELDQYQGGIGTPMEKFIWNDMFDKQMNAVSRYWQVNGDLTPSATVKLDPSYVIVNWTGGGKIDGTEDEKRLKSLQYFHEAGHKQIAALYYDNLDSVKHWLDVMSNSGAPRLDGIMYTTWIDKDDELAGYKDLAEVAKQMRNRFKDRWPTKPAQ